MMGSKSFWMVLLGCSLLLAGLFAEVRPAAAQSAADCVRPEGVAEIPTPGITASEVEANPTPENLMSFALAAKDHMQGLTTSGMAFTSCVFRHEGEWKSGSVYTVFLSVSGTVLFHSGEMGFGGRQLREDAFTTIAATVGLETFTDPLTGTLGSPHETEKIVRYATLAALGSVGLE